MNQNTDTSANSTALDSTAVTDPADTDTADTNTPVTNTEDPERDWAAGHGEHDGPHECEFCSPEPELIPAPWERAPGEGGSGGDDAPQTGPPTESTTDPKAAS
jgi:hypothetical protein